LISLDLAIENDEPQVGLSCYCVQPFSPLHRGIFRSRQSKLEMKTLYDILGALPDDDAEDIRIAFRKAVKATHPDVNGGDPDTLLRFRQIVRAHAILGDAAQRATYDRLMAYAQRRGSVPVTSDRIQNFASGAITVAVISMGLIGAYALFGPVSRASITQVAAIEVAARAPADIAAITPEPQAEPTAVDQPRDRSEGIEVPDEATAPGAAALAVDTASGIGGAPAQPAMKDAKLHREQGISAYRDGDLHRALAEFDRAIQRDPHFAEVYVDRGIVFYRMRKFNRAFADMAEARRIASAARPPRPASPAPRKAPPPSGRS
jgi:tetratricopeptide (TPR) repeat protein